MGIKIRPYVNCIPVSLQDKTLSFEIGNKTYSYRLDGLNFDIQFPKQLCGFENKSIFVRLVNDSYIMSLFSNGVGQIVSTKDKLLLYTFDYDVPYIDTFYIECLGSLKSHTTGKYYPLDCMIVDYKRVILSSQNSPLALSMELIDNPLLLYIISCSKYCVTTSFKEINGKYYLEDAEVGKYVELKCEICKPESTRMY